MVSHVRRQFVAGALWLLWAVALLAVYYKQIWRLFVIGPAAWVADNYSLAFIPKLWHLVAAGPPAWGLPAFTEALTRALAAIFGAGCVLLAAQVLGAAICWLLRWQPADWRERALFQIAAGLSALSSLGLGLALLSLYRPVNIQLLLALTLLGGSAWLGRRLMHLRRHKVKTQTRPVSTARYQAWDKLWQAIALLAILIAFTAALAPEKEYDALWYHLGFPKLWLEQGYLVDLPAEYVSLYPMAWKLIFGMAMAWGGPIAAKLLHFACLPLTGLLTYQLTRRFAPRVSPWLAVALFVTVPTALWEASTAYVDLALSLHIGLTVYALLSYSEEPRWQWLVLAALNLGLALATKHLVLLVLPLVTGGLALCLWLKDYDWRRALTPALSVGLLSLLLPLPWYVRSWLATGNPVFPEWFSLFGGPPDRWDANTQEGLNRFLAHFGHPRTPLNLLTLPWDMTVHAAPYGGTLGPLFLLLLPALCLVRYRSRATPWLMSLVLLYGALWASPISSFQMRFLVLMTPVLAVLAAEACGRLASLARLLARRARPWRPLRNVVSFRKAVPDLFYATLTALLLLNLPPFTSLHESDRVGWDGWLTHVIHRVPIGVVIGRESQEDYLARTVPSYAAWRYINTHLPANARVLTFSGGDHLYSNRERIWSDATIARPAVWGAPRGQEEQAFQTLLKLNISYVLFGKQQLASLQPDTLAIAPLPERTAWYDLEYEDNRFALYRLNWERIKPELAGPSASSRLVTQEIRYHMPEASEVFLVWGINGWNVVVEKMRPAGTVVKDAVMHTPMAPEGDTFVAKVQISSGTTVDYGFLITKTRSGTTIKVWEANGKQDYHTIATKDGVIEVQTGLTLAQVQTAGNVPGTILPLVIGLSIVFGISTTLIIRRDSVALYLRTLLHRRRLIYLRDLLRELVARDMKLRYKRSVLGIAWSLLNPLAQLLIFTFLFRRVLPLNIPNYPLFVFSGVLAWSWFQSSLFLATGAITDNRELIRRPGFPAAILPVVTVTSNLVHFLLALPILLLFVLIGGVHLTSTSLMLPLVIVLQFLLTLSLAYLVATFHVTFRDTQHLLGVLLLLLFYLTPVFYDASAVPARYQPFYRLNPMLHLINAYRAILIRGELPDSLSLLGLGLLAVVLLWLGYAVFMRASYRFVEEL